MHVNSFKRMACHTKPWRSNFLFVRALLRSASFEGHTSLSAITILLVCMSIPLRGWPAIRSLGEVIFYSYGPYYALRASKGILRLVLSPSYSYACQFL